jgi:carboxypeptidase Taq
LRAVTIIEQDSAEAKDLDFTRSDERIAELLQRMNEAADLYGLAALADWDQQTAMPRGASETRMYQMATLQGIAHGRWTEPRLGELLRELGEAVTQPSFTEADRALVREARRAYDRATKLPRELVEEMERVKVASFEAWVGARQNSDFATFAPWLKRTVALQREVADRLGGGESKYDLLLDEYEPGLTAVRVDELFAPVRDVSVALLKRIQDSGNSVDASSLYGSFSKEKQHLLSERMLQRIGYDLTYGEIAASAHPFTTSFGAPFDVRLTVRFDEKYLPTSLMAALHEGGHALYEQGIAPTLVRTPLAGGTSLGVHESQSRLWENGIGRSEAFWRGQIDVVREVFPEQFSNIDAATFAQALNSVQPSLIRVEADEVTYNLHIIIRFELERALINGEIEAEELPGLWNAKYRDYLGIEPPNDAQGVLQDMHWSSGFGYFPTYTLGNLYSAQILHTLKSAFPDFDERLAAGDTNFVLQWLREYLYAYGAIYRPRELIKRVTGEVPDPRYFVQYLTDKFGRIYNLS